MRYFSIILLAFNFIIAGTAVAQQENFNPDSAYAYLEHLCVTIGPRPMGSVNERAALKWTVEQFHRFGADTAYVMPVPEANGRINTTSGVAIGIFRGATDSTIVIGGHIDSSGREVPGANDDGSGTACVIELARNWSQRPRRFTLLFAAFGGEESGLVGSKYFVSHYADLDKVKLMLQIDMAGSPEALIPFIDVYTHQAPEWLVEDAYAFDRMLGYNSLKYPTHFFSINNAIPGGGAGSDHQPFLEKNIPAIDFTAGVNTSPIHTPGDKMEFISKPMLARSGRLVEAMLTKYQEQGIPAPQKANYMLWETSGGRWYIPMWLITATNVTAVLLSMFAFYWSRKKRLIIEKNQRIKFSGFKLFFITIIVAIFVQLGEATMQFLKELRYPWFAPLNHYLWFAAIWSTFGIWVALQLTRKWKFSPDPYVYTKRAIISLLVVFALFSFATSRLALYPALSLIAISLAILLPNTILKLIATILAPLPMLRLMFFEMFPLGARSMAESLQGVNTWIEAFLYSAFLTAILILWYLPMLYLSGYTLTSSWAKLSGLKVFRHPVVGLVLMLIIVGYGGYLYSFPAYDQTWRLELTAEAEYNLRSGKSQLRLAGSEFLREVTVTADTVHRQYDTSSNAAALPISFKADWFKLAGTETMLADSLVHVDWQINSVQPWHKVTLTLHADTAKISNLNTALQYAQNKNVSTFTWFADPPETLRVAASFSMLRQARLIREIKAEYPQTPVPVKVTAKYAEVIYQTTVTYRDTLPPIQSALTAKPANSL
ncbi:MAG: hypothetical protein ALAOOOJD_00691 [bacterium]|nr:hypothetical protein [bacterium]